MAPKIFEPPVLTEGGLGESVTLTCTARGLPPPEYTWFRLGGNESIPLENETNSTLTFDRLVISDRGVYSCQARNVLGNDPGNNDPGNNAILQIEGETLA